MPPTQTRFSIILVFGLDACNAVYTTSHMWNLFACRTKTMDNAVAMPSQTH